MSGETDELSLAVLTELNRADKPDRAGKGLGLAMGGLVSVCGAVALIAFMSGRPPVAQNSTEPVAAVATQSQPAAQGGFTGAISLQPLQAAPQVTYVLAAAQPYANMGPPLDPDPDGELATMPKAPANLARARYGATAVIQEN